MSVVIRCKFHGILNREGQNEVISIKTKMEYSPDFGAEVFTPEERVRSWVHSHVRGDSKLIVAHIDPLAHSLVSCTITKPSLDMPESALGAQSANLLYHMFKTFKR